MVLAEVLIEKDYLEEKIEQLERYLTKVCYSSKERTDRASGKLLELIDKHRSHLIKINEINNKVQMTVGGSTVSLANVVLITKTMWKRIDLLNNLIDRCGDGSEVLDIFSLIEQRDTALAEYTIISNQLQAVEWSTEVD